MLFIVDTNVVSELRKAPKGKADSNVVRWRVAADTSTLYLSVITIHELEVGILLSQRRNAAHGAALRIWMDDYIVPSYAGRIVSIDAAVARRGAALHVPTTRPWADALIAATALVHGMTVVTRNVCDFQSTGVAVLNPWLK
jgi:predicted nucleic acid-binding protein